MQATVLDLRRNTRSILNALQRNERVVLTNRGRQQAVIVACSGCARTSAAAHPAFGMWKDRDDLENVSGTIRRLRKGRSF